MEAKDIVGRMMASDDFSQWLGIEVLETGAGHSKLRMTIRQEMTNGFDIAHGGIAYSLGDSALAFAANGHGRQAMSVETSIAHVQPIRLGDVLTARATEVKRTNKLAWYSIDIMNQSEELVASFRGMVYRTSRPWEVREEGIEV